MFDALQVKYAQCVGHPLVAVVAEVVVGQGHAIEKTIAQEFHHPFVALQMRSHLFNFFCLPCHYRALQVEYTIVVCLVDGFHTSQQITIFTLLQEELGPMVDNQVARYHYFYHKKEFISAFTLLHNCHTSTCCCSGSSVRGARNVLRNCSSRQCALPGGTVPHCTCKATSVWPCQWL